MFGLSNWKEVPSKKMGKNEVKPIWREDQEVSFGNVELGVSVTHLYFVPSSFPPSLLSVLPSFHPSFPLSFPFVSLFLSFFLCPALSLCNKLPEVEWIQITPITVL